jgi:hypothetical protein
MFDVCNIFPPQASHHSESIIDIRCWLAGPVTVLLAPY